MFFEIITCIFLESQNYGSKFGSGIQFFFETWNNMLVFFFSVQEYFMGYFINIFPVLWWSTLTPIRYL